MREAGGGSEDKEVGEGEGRERRGIKFERRTSSGSADGNDHSHQSEPLQRLRAGPHVSLKHNAQVRETTRTCEKRFSFPSIFLYNAQARETTNELVRRRGKTPRDEEEARDEGKQETMRKQERQMQGQGEEEARDDKEQGGKPHPGKDTRHVTVFETKITQTNDIIVIL